MPAAPESRDSSAAPGTHDAHQLDLDVISSADELGYREAWIGERFTAPWEPVPAPDMMIAQAPARAKNIKPAAAYYSRAGAFS